MKLSVLVLAAGKGTRMKSGIPKILHPILGMPMIHYVVNTVSSIKPDRLLMVIGSDGERIKNNLDKFAIEYVYQQAQLGTGHAVNSAKAALLKFNGNILIINGDFPLITTKTLKSFVSKHSKGKSILSILTTELTNPTGYGRIIRGAKGDLIEVVEEKDCTQSQKQLKEINSGLYLVQSGYLWKLLGEISSDNSQNEYYLPDIVRLSIKNGYKVSSYKSPDPDEVMGVNDRAQLCIAETILKMRINKSLMLGGVHIIDPESTYISPGVKIGRDTSVYPNSFLVGNTVIGKNTIIGPSCWIEDASIGNDVQIRMNCYVEKSVVSDNVIVGPFAHVRPDTLISSNSKIGNFVELKNSQIGLNSKVPHLSYIGDATIGKNVNIGAGTITCNYDGLKKYKTVIEDNVFIGSDTMLVAPLRVGRNSTTGAGSTITKDVGENTLAISRAKQTSISNWKRKPK